MPVQHSTCFPKLKSEKIINILPKRHQVGFNTRIKRVTMGDLMTLGGWVTTSVGVSPAVKALTMTDLDTIAKALMKHTKTKYQLGVPCCCSCT